MSDLVTVGSSDVAAIMGLSPWSSPWSAWGRLTGLTERYNQSDTPAQARGRMMESAIGARFAEEYAVELEPGPPIGEPGLIGPEPWMHARHDFAVVYTDALLECKTTKVFDDDWGPPGTDLLPPYYHVQCVWQMAVLDYSLTYLAAFGMFRDEWRVYIIHRDMDVERGVVDYVRAWYQRHVVGGDPPPVDGSSACSSLLAGRIAAKDEAPMREATDDERYLVDQYRMVSTRLDLEASTKALLRQQLAERIDDAAGLTVDGKRLVSLRRSVRSGKPSFTLKLEKS